MKGNFNDIHLVKSKMSCLGKTPDDILLKVFAFFELKELLTASEVCRSWRRVAHDSSLWSVLDLQPYQNQLREPTILDILQNNFAPLGRKLSLSGYNITTEMLQLLFKKCRYLDTLNLKECKFQITCGSSDFGDELVLLKKLDLRRARGYSLEIEAALEKAVNLECLGMNCCFPSRMNRSVFINKPLLRMLDCTMCDWLNDDFIQIIAKNCPRLEYLSLNRCYNFTGTSLKELLQSCRILKTLLLPNTRIDDANLLKSNWQNSSITSIDIRHCSRVSHTGVSAVLSCLPRLRYLRCALTDENFRLLQHHGFPEVEVLQMLRRYPITIDIACNLLIGCPRITCLEVSSVPFSHVHFQAFLPRMPSLKWLCFAANDCCGTNLILHTLSHYSKRLEYLWLVYYHSNERDNVISAFKELIIHCPMIKMINLTGLYVNDLLSELEFVVKNTGVPNHVELVQNEKFLLPQPEPNVDSFMEF